MSTWTVMWWPARFDFAREIPVPYARTYGSLGEAVIAAHRGVEAGTVEWIKVYGPGGENDIRARWDACEGDTWTELSREAERILATRAA